MLHAWNELTWIALVGFALGSAYKLVSMALLARRDKVVYPTMDARFGARSVGHWLLPFGSRSMRLHPLFTVLSFAFHVCLLLAPLLAAGHAMLWRQAWGLPWPSLPGWLIDTMTLGVLGVGVYFLARRILLPEVRYVSAWRDFLVLLVVLAPFATGLAAHQHWFNYEITIAAHIACGVIWLLAIPFTRLSHMLWFVFSRAYMGSEFGSVRHARDW
ncbi:MAG: hypothetical protein MUF54_05060 [Polyangiaceae bacterium]|jgi:nitrate reductase gamma subunit|nr:hypothetical protein [Polyangiaceae bacterium]